MSMIFCHLMLLAALLELSSVRASCESFNSTSSTIDEFLKRSDLKCMMIAKNATLSSVVSFENVASLSISGATVGLVTVTCVGNSGLSFRKVSNLMLENLKFVECGIYVESTSTNTSSDPPNHTNWTITTAIYIADSHNVTLRQVDIVNSHGVGLVIFNTGGTIKISYCRFIGNCLSPTCSHENENHSYPGGGGLHIELIPLQPPVINNSNYFVQDCYFEANVATSPVAYASDGTSQYYGRGGGLFIGLAGQTMNNSFLIDNCTFKENMAVWGGALAMYMVNQVQQSHILLHNCHLEDNSSPMHGGGGALIALSKVHTDKLHNDSIVFKNCHFTGNQAIFGGGLEFAGFLGSSALSLIHFMNCTFDRNKANSSAAVDITPLQKPGVTTGLQIHFTSCEFVGNRVIDNLTPIQNNTATQFKSGTGTFSVLYLDVTFLERVVFKDNSGTALFVIAGYVSFEQGIEAIFANNHGHNGGAIALMASSIMTVKKNSSFTFDSNTAVRSGAAIFALSAGLHQLHRLVVTTCFFGNCADCSDSVVFYFAKNQAGIGGNSSVIYSDNLPACAAQCSTSVVSTEEISADTVFSCVGKFNFCEHCEQGTCCNCSSSATGKIRGLPDQFKIGNSVPIPVFPGQNFDLSLNVSDEIGNTLSSSYYVTHVGNSSMVQIDQDSVYVTNNSARINAIPPIDTTISLRRLGFYDLQLRINVSILECPPGYALNSRHQCSCRDDQDEEWYRGVLCKDGARIVHGKWMGYMGTNHSPVHLYTSLCPYGFCTYNITNNSLFSSSYPLSVNSAELERFICMPSREGRACGKCVDGFSVYFNSPQFTCNVDNNSCQYGWLLYILSDLVSLTFVYVVVVVILNWSFTSGLVNGFIFYAQVIDTLVVNANGINGLKPSETWLIVLNEMYLFIYNSFNLEFFGVEKLSFCLWPGAGILDVLVMKYVTIVYAFVLVLGTVFVLNRFKLCCKCACFKSQKSVEDNHIIHGLSAFFISCYVLCMRVTFLILTPTHLEGFQSRYSRYNLVYYSGHLDYFRGKHLYYAIPALLCAVVVLIPVPIALLVYPLFLKLFALCGWAESKTVKCLSVPFEKAKPLLDSFQSSYKDNFRFVAGLLFIYRTLILFSYAASVGYGQFYVALAIQLTVMIILHFIMQPHQVHCHNILDVLLFSNLAAINSLSLYKLGISYQHNPSSALYIKAASILQLVLIYIPLAVVLVWGIAKFALTLKRRVKPKVKSLMSREPFSELDYSSYEQRSIRLASFN